MTPEAQELLGYKWHRETWEALCKENRPIVVELVPRVRNHPCRKVISHTMFVHVVDHYTRLGLLRLVEATATRWRYEIVRDAT